MNISQQNTTTRTFNMLPKATKEKLELPVVISTPHSSGFIPHNVLYTMLGDNAFDLATRENFLAYMFHEGDPYTDLMFHVPHACHLHALTSRFVVDLNRKRNSEGENGVIKLTDFEQNPLYPENYKLSNEEIEDRLRRHWDPFHETYAELLAQPHITFFIDGHSMMPFGPKIGPDKGVARPAWTIMTGGDALGEPIDGQPVSIPPHIARTVAESLQRHFKDYMTLFPDVPAEVRLNSPWDVTPIPQRYSSHIHRTPKPGFSIEINRALYLQPRADGLSDVIPDSIETINQIFIDFVKDIIPYFANQDTLS